MGSMSDELLQYHARAAPIEVVEALPQMVNFQYHQRYPQFR